MIGKWVAGLVVMVAAVAGWSAPAWSCMEPEASFQLDGLVVPSTVAGALYRNCESQVPAVDPEFSMWEEVSGEPVQISWEQDRHGLYEIFFEEDLSEFTVYEFEANPECPTEDGSDPRSWTFETGEAAELPDELGLWVASNPVVGTIRYPGAADQSCSVQAEASYVELEFEPAPDAELWGEAIAFTTYVNNEIWEPAFGVGETVPAGSGRWGWGEEQVYSVCDERKPEPQPHAELLDRWVNIQISARLPGTELVWLSENEVLALICPDRPSEDVEEPDEVEEEPEEEEEEEETELVPADDEEGSCSQVGGGTSGWLLSAWLLGWVAARRRVRS